MVVVTCGLTGWEDGRSEFSGKDMDPSNGPEHLFLLLRRYDYPVGFTSDHTWCCRWQALFAFRRLHDQFAKSRSQLFVCVNNDRKGAECHWHSISQDDMGGWKGSHDVLTSIIWGARQPLYWPFLSNPRNYLLNSGNYLQHPGNYLHNIEKLFAKYRETICKI